MSLTTTLVKQVDAALAEGDVARARSAISTAVTAEPDSPDVQVALARVEVAEGAAADAEARLRSAVARFPRHGPAAGFLGALLVGLGRHDEARPLLERAVLDGQAAPAVKLAWGRVLARAGQVDRALLFFEQAVAGAPRVAQAHHFLGLAYGELGRYGDAARCLASAVQLDPSDLASWQALIRLHLAPDPERAFSLLAEARRVNPGSAAMARVAAEVLFEAGRPGEAMAALEEIPDAQRDAEDDVVAAWGQMQAARWDEARRLARSAVARDGSWWRARYTLGVALESEEPLPRAEIEAAYRAAIEQGDPRGEAGTRLGFLLLEGDRPRTDEAIAILEAARERSGDAPGTLLNLAIAHRQRGDTGVVARLCDAILAAPGATENVRAQAERLRST